MAEKIEFAGNVDFIKDWSQWRSVFKDAIHRARNFGMSNEMIQDLSVEVGEFLATRIYPATKQEELLKEMWDVATPNEQRTLATLIFKIVDNP